jgi:hypothetical protein
MRRTRISILCAVVLAGVPAGAEAGGLGSVVGAVASAPRALLGGLFGGGRARHARHPVHQTRHATTERTAARATTERTVARAAPATAVETMPVDRPSTAMKTAHAASTTFWPAAYTDAFAYVLTPASYDGAFWGRGFADVVDAMFASSAADVPGKKPGRGRAADSGTGTGGDGIPASACTEPENPGALIDRVERAVPPSEAQRAAFDRLGSALRAAAERVRTACATDLSGGPSARLEAMWRLLRALRQAVILVRAPLGNFYTSLDEDQKARLDSLAREGAGVRGATREAKPDSALRACSASARMPEWPVASITQAIQPTEDQRPMLELLMGTSLHYAHELRASCPDAPALTPMARLEAADQRLNDLIYAVTVLRVTLNKFNSSLSGEQRARFDAMGSAQAERRVELR